MILLEGKKQLKITSKKPVVLYGTRNAFRSKSNGHLIEVTISSEWSVCISDKMFTIFLNDQNIEFIGSLSSETEKWTTILES